MAKRGLVEVTRIEDPADGAPTDAKRVAAASAAQTDAGFQRFIWRLLPPEK